MRTQLFTCQQWWRMENCGDDRRADGRSRERAREVIGLGFGSANCLAVGAQEGGTLL